MTRVERTKKVAGAAALLITLAIAVATLVYFSSVSDVKPPEPKSDVQPDVSVSDAGPDSTSVALQPTGPLVAFVTPDGGAVAVAGHVGGPGIYPAFQVASTTGEIPFPVEYEGEEVPTLEARIVSNDSAFAYWGDLRVDQKRVALEPATVRDVRVIAPDGQPVAGADIRLGRGSLGFISVEATTDSQGLARFEGLPPGSYVATTVHRGFLRDVTPVDDAQTTVVLERGHPLSGKVEHDGNPVVGAFVVIWRGDLDVPVDIVDTQMDGTFRSEGLPQDVPVYAVAYHDDFIACRSSSFRLPIDTLIRIECERGVATSIRVVDDSGTPVANALVSWQADSDHGSVACDKEGRAQLTAVPRGASYQARIGSFVSERTLAEIVLNKGEVTLTLKRPEAPTRLRIRGPVGVTEVRAAQGKTICDVESAGDGIWLIRGCKNKATIDIGTLENGVYTTQVSLDDDRDIVVPAPHTLEITVSPAEARLEWKDDDRWRSCVVTDGTARLSLLEDELTVRASARGYIGQTRVLSTRKNAAIELDRAIAVRVRVTDDRDALLTGVWVSRWTTAPLGRFRRSAGQLPLEVSLEDTSERLVAIDPRRGEALLQAPSGDVVMRLDSAIGSLSIPGRPTIPQVEKWLGASLTRDENGYRVDVTDPDSKAALAGVKRGSWYVVAWEKQGRFITTFDGREFSTHRLSD